MILISLFAFAYGGIGGFNGRSEPSPLLIADLDQTRASKEIIKKIESLEGVRIFVSDAMKSKELVIKGKYACALIIYKGFQDSLEAGKALPLELVYDRSREMEIGILQQNLISTLMSTKGEIIAQKSIGIFLRNQFPTLDISTIENLLKTAINKSKAIINDFAPNERRFGPAN